MPNSHPQHMDRWSRNERLYHQFLDLGLYVVPIFADKERARIDYLHVSVDLPIFQQPAEESTVSGVMLPVEGAEITNVIRPTHCGGDGVVVKFPSKL